MGGVYFQGGVVRGRGEVQGVGRDGKIIDSGGMSRDFGKKSGRGRILAICVVQGVEDDGAVEGGGGKKLRVRREFDAGKRTAVVGECV